MVRGGKYPPGVCLGFHVTCTVVLAIPAAALLSLLHGGPCADFFPGQVGDDPTLD